MTVAAKFASFLGAIMLVLAGPPALAQVADPVGTWHGSISTPRGDLTLVVYVERAEDGQLKAEVESPDQAPGRKIAVSEISLTGDVLKFGIAPLNAKYEGTWSPAEQHWNGTFSQGAALPLVLERGTPEARPVIEGLDGRWESALELNGARLRLILKVTTDEGGTRGTIDSPDQLAYGLPVSNLAREGNAISFDFAGGQSFSGKLSPDEETIGGTWATPGRDPVPLTFARTSEEAGKAAVNHPQTPRPPFPYVVEEVAFDNPSAPDVRLAGTLTRPEGDGPFPAAILITGSGAQDRDETLLGHKPFAVIADHLTRHGFAVLRYDDRGTAKSTGEFAGATSADFATDANAAARFLASRPEIRDDAIGFIGHSEGGMVAPIAMADNPDIAFAVLLAGPGTALDQLMLSQRRLAGSQMGMSQEMLDRSEPVMAAVFTAIGQAETPEKGRAAARAVLTPDALVALGAPPDADPDVVLNQLTTPWFSYFLKYDPAPNLARITVPVLALNGSLDRQVPAGDNLAAIASAMAGNPDVTTRELPGLNHLFQTARTGAVGEYADIEETFAPVALDAITDWLSARFLK